MRVTRLARTTGFTLLEVLIAAGLFMVVMGLAAAFFLQALTLRQECTDTYDLHWAASRAVQQIGRDARQSSGFEIAGTRLVVHQTSGETVTYVADAAERQLWRHSSTGARTATLPPGVALSHLWLHAEGDLLTVRLEVQRSRSMGRPSDRYALTAVTSPRGLTSPEP
jgi:Tfp pilus assembly protein PilV